MVAASGRCKPAGRGRRNPTMIEASATDYSAGVMRASNAPRIAIGPVGQGRWMADAVVAGGGQLVDIEAAEGLMWADPRDPNALDEAIRHAPDLRWIQLPFAGVEPFVHLVGHDMIWTCGKGVYAEPVAELALTLALAGMRGLGAYARRSAWSAQQGTNLLGGRVTILGGGGITESLLRLLRPFDCHVTVVRNRLQAMDGADEVLEADQYVDALPGADLVVLALPLTPETEGIIGYNELSMMERNAWLVNVARGKHVVTDDLVRALSHGLIAGAGLDVTDPEPLPTGHPLWQQENCLITPHVATTDAMGDPLLAERITRNVQRFAHGGALVGIIDPDLGY